MQGFYVMLHHLMGLQVGQNIVIVALIIVKAQSLSSHPEYQEFTDSRAAISRIGTVLSDANFTVEEFYAVLELFLLGDDT
jgi:hypothetical protein